MVGDDAVASEYSPARGDIVWLTFSPVAGHEEAGRRPALILSNTEYNMRSGLIVACPITRQVKGYPFEVLLGDDLDVQGVVLADHMKSVDWRARRVHRICSAPTTVVERVVELVSRLIRD